MDMHRLNTKQRTQVAKQLRLHRHTQKYTLDIALGRECRLRRYVMYPHVLQPMSSRHLARYIYRHPAIVRDKIVIDIGTGSGLQGIAAAKSGASKVILSDISMDACRNATENVLRFSVDDVCDVVQGDLFDSIHVKANVIIFAQPFFDATPSHDLPVTMGMLDPGVLILRFFRSARTYLLPEGRIYMPMLDLASTANDPATQGPRSGYDARLLMASSVRNGIQIGRVSIYELRPVVPLPRPARGRH